MVHLRVEEQKEQKPAVPLTCFSHWFVVLVCCWRSTSQKSCQMTQIYAELLYVFCQGASNIVFKHHFATSLQLISKQFNS